MHWTEALDLITDYPAFERLRFQCRIDNPDVGQRDAARATVVRKALNQPQPQPARSETITCVPCGCNVPLPP